jgi:hypothetical protein
MRNFIDILTEASIVDNGRESGCRVWKNPSFRELATLAGDRDLRGLVDGNNVYVWQADQATHRMVPDQIGIPYHDYLLPFYVEADGYSLADKRGRSEWADGNPDFQVGSMGVYCDKGDVVVDDYLYSRGFCRMVGHEAVDPLANQ